MKEKILYWLCFAFFLSIFLKDMPVVSNILIAALTVYSVFFLPRAPLRMRPAIILAFVFGALQVLSAVFSTNHPAAMLLLVRRTPLVVFPLGIGLIAIRRELRDRILLAWCYVITLTAFACLLQALNHVRLTGDAQWLYDDNFTVLIGWQSTYFAIAVNIALFSLLYVLWKKAYVFRYRVPVYVMIGFLLVCHYLLASRTALIVLYASLVVLAVAEGVRLRGYRLAALRVAGVLALLGMLRLAFPKTANRFRELQYTGYHYSNEGAESHFNMPVTADQWNGANIRLAIWQCSWKLAERHLLTGIPLGEKQDSLTAEYKAQGFDFAYQRRRNTHSTYLDVLINTGVFGVVLFVFAWVAFPLLTRFRTADGLGLFVVITIAAAMVTENWADRMVGCVLLGFFISFVNACELQPLSARYKRTASRVSPKKTSLPLAR